MRRIPAIVTMLASAIGMSGAPTLAAPRDAAKTLRVMTFNVRIPVASDAPNDWPHRRDLFAATIRKEAPDLFGTQELKAGPAKDIAARLPGYRWFGIDRRGGHDDEHMGIFYRPDRLDLLQSGNFWLSDTPGVPGSISWGQPLPRMVTWGLFERKSDHRRFYEFNTHFPYRDQDVAARTKAAQEIAAHIAALPAGIPVVLTGDFNTDGDSRAHAILTRALHDVRQTAPAVSGPDATFHGFTGKPTHRIDWILERGFRPIEEHTVTDHDGAIYPSDHFPVVADLAFR